MKTVIVKKDVVKKAAIFLLWMSMMAMAGTVSAAVYKCTGDDGKVEFSDTPCAGKDSEAMDLQYNTIGDSDGGKASKSAARSSSKKESSGSKPAKKSSAKTAKTSAANKYAKDGSERRFIGHGMTTTEVRS
ncbi:MAG: DUF4124 domain-containing protein, partial [Burkholderiales bacterium]|nr:DUF4124 domain-containing protein [Burkholderiales bacterium]